VLRENEEEFITRVAAYLKLLEGCRDRDTVEVNTMTRKSNRERQAKQLKRLLSKLSKVNSDGE
jgi:hypothetical protein